MIIFWKKYRIIIGKKYRGFSFYRLPQSNERRLVLGYATVCL